MLPDKPRYIILRTASVIDLQILVDAAMRDGYQPAGSLVVEYEPTITTRRSSGLQGSRTQSIPSQETWYAQALVLKP